MISHKYKFIFVHLGRTGGSTFERIADVGLTSDKKSQGLGNTDFREKHAGFQYYRRRYPSEFASYFKFTIVRNPFDRVVSSWFWLTRVIRVMSPCTLKEFIRWRPINSTYASKLSLAGYSLRDSLKQLDYIGRFEDLPGPYEEVRQKLGVPWKPIPHTNQTPIDTYWDFYDPETIALVQDLYRDDLELFDYKFGPSVRTSRASDELAATAPRVTSGRKEVESILERQRATPHRGPRFYPNERLVHADEQVTVALGRSDPPHLHLLVVPTLKREHITPELGQPITADDLDQVAEVMTTAQRASVRLGVKEASVFLNPAEMIDVGYLRVHLVGERESQWTSPHIRPPFSARRLLRRLVIGVRGVIRPVRTKLTPDELVERERLALMLKELRAHRAAELDARAAYFERLTRGDSPEEHVVHRDALVTAFLHRSDPRHPSNASARNDEPGAAAKDPLPAHLLVIPNAKRAHLATRLDQQITIEDLREVAKVMDAARRVAEEVGVQRAVIFISPSETVSVGYLHVHVVGERAATPEYPKV